MTIALMVYFVVLTYLSDLRNRDQWIIISLIVLGTVFYYLAFYMSIVFGYMNRRYESYPDIIWKILGVFFTFIGIFLLVTNNIINFNGY